MKESDRQSLRTELARVRRELATATGRRRVDVILDAKDPAAIVPALPADELWFAIHETGLADAAELVPLASPAQFRTFLDLEVWKGADPVPRRALAWIRAARTGAAANDEDAARWSAKLGALDLELLDLVLLDTLRIHDLEADPDPEIQGDRFMRTPENRFIVEFLVDGVEYVAVRGLLDDLYAEDPFRATRLLSAVRWELPSELTESALRWRTARMQDLGYPSIDEALSWFAKPAGAPAARAGLPARPPGFFLQPVQPGSLLARAAAGLDAAARTRLELELVTAANAVLVADAVEVDDLEEVRASMAAARALVELGLEEASAGGDAAAALATTPVKTLFQRGFGRALALKWRAERLLASGRTGSRDRPFLDAPLGEALAALARKRPQFHPGVALPRTAWGAPEAAAAEPRAFLSSAELGAAAAALDAVEALTALAARLGLAPVPDGTRLAALYLTALANERLGRGFSPDPLPEADVPRAAAALEDLRDPRLDAEGDAGALLASLARARAEELAPVRDGTLPPDAATAALRVGPRS